VIGFLRGVGVLNAAVWFGSAFFMTFAVRPTASSADMEKLLGGNNFPYYSGAIVLQLMTSFLGIQLICGIIALLHLLGERLYFGRAPQKFLVSLVVGLFLLGQAVAFALPRKLAPLHTQIYAVNLPAAARESARPAFRTWDTLVRVVNLVTLAGLGVYVWRLASPQNRHGA
jgi:hypothetical protein